MKALIMSDSHGLTEEVQLIKERHQGEVDAVFHCGDSELPLCEPTLEKIHIVMGNCDYDQKLPEEIIVDIKGVRFFVTHGHLHNVKSTLMNVKYRAEETNAQVVCFGHSHIAGVDYIDGILFLNPGSIHLPRVRREKTYAILEIEENKATVQFFEDSGKQVNELTHHFSLA
ncbi:metallophosphoesterase family protein [Metabacillus arenae]|uniref:Phosphoesterase n=1 Tax=Metabacillus arenae TaxID=2771434 RepID=A0A926NCV7_9BACI|nr:metallophosphoesterase [Metabacillus arenae]MBD1381164.1 metallophosphoesterase [Metabacillus arenae]